MKWRRGETLGVGASGMVSLALVDDQAAFDHDLPCVMAVKSAPLHESRSICRERRYLDRFEGCPNVVRCFGSDTTTEEGEDWYNLFLEYASGGSLFDRIRRSGRGGLPESEARRYAKSILLGLNHVHKQGYVHCDIKPHNVVLVESESEVIKPPMNLNGKRKRVEKEHTAKIADFGVAMKAGKRKEDQESKGKLRGTPMYIAPESIRCGEYEAHSDIWALGCTVLHMLTGELPWKCDKNTEKAALLFKIGFREEVPEIPSHGLSKEAQDFLNKCLVRDPKPRWTGDMLLAHPFVSGHDCMTAESIKGERSRVVQPQKAAKEVHDLSSSQSSFDLTKPYLLMSRSALNGILPDFSKIRTIKKAKRAEEEGEEKEKKFESSFRPDAWERCWGIKPIPVIPSSNIAIEIFN
ncbi:mitogen-activated protein kinase kinase kinase 20-like [Rhododendron vialii]|uniref:mitogen-activated protein kinase kinase kinase 20-like n=1 Tax=Rhododendron vialii TaxID=182163 RepID=UPI00265EE921|nr:mitogen-activated protein kinase kinase kinase 20-like [Rhododendron vialii]